MVTPDAQGPLEVRVKLIDAEMIRVKVQPGEVVVVRFKGHIDRGVAQKIQGRLESVFTHNEVLILADGVVMEFVSSDTAKELKRPEMVEQPTDNKDSLSSPSESTKEPKDEEGMIPTEQQDPNKLQLQPGESVETSKGDENPITPGSIASIPENPPLGTKKD